MTNPPKRRTSQIIYDAIVDLHAQEQAVTRTSLAAVTGLKLSIIDETVDKLIEVDETVRRVERGVYVPVRAFGPARAVSVTTLTDGTVKIEVGDDCLDLSPREARLLATPMVGHAVQYSNIQAGNEAGQLALTLANKVRKLERELAALRSGGQEDRRQMALQEAAA